MKWLGLQRIPKEPSKAPAEALADDPIAGYELYAAEPKGRWVKLLDLEKEVDFQEVEDARPGYTYKLASRSKSGKIRTIWHQAVPGEISGAQKDPVGAMIDALEPFKAFGERISALKDSIQGAFGWALTPSSGSGGSGTPPTYKGELPIWVHPQVAESFKAWTPVLREMGKEAALGVKEGFFGGGEEEKKGSEKGVGFTRPPPSADEFLKEQEAAKGGA